MYNCNSVINCIHLATSMSQNPGTLFFYPDSHGSWMMVLILMEFPPVLPSFLGSGRSACAQQAQTGAILTWLGQEQIAKKSLDAFTTHVC